MNWTRVTLIVACLLAGTAVGLGAYQAHGLERYLEGMGASSDEIAKRLDNCAVAVRYQMWHALALFAIGLLSLASGRRIVAAPVLLTLGVALFSGGLYEIVFRGSATHFAIVPAGGSLMLLGWTTLAVSLLTMSLKRDETPAG